MMLARDARRRQDSNLTTIAEAIGYESDTAFSLAFKRMFGLECRVSAWSHKGKEIRSP